jgi:nicotinamidase-related amidase
LYITGCATDFCVNATIHSALVKDFNITVVRDCHSTADRPNFKAEKLIDFHNWLWANLTPTNGTIQVKELKEIIS